MDLSASECKYTTEHSGSDLDRRLIGMAARRSKQLLSGIVRQSRTGLPDRQNTLRWPTALSPSVGSWNEGESNCQVLGPTWHFWAPETPYEQGIDNYLIGVSNQPVWLNMKIAPQNVRPPLVATPAAINTYWHKGVDPYPAFPYSFTKGGTGGSLTVSAASAPASQTPSCRS